MSKKNESGMAYNMSKLNKVFAFLSFLLLVTTFWVFLDDYIRPWKAVQIEAQQIKKKKLIAQIKEADGKIDKKELTALEQQLEESKKTVSKRESKIVAVKAEIKAIQKEITAETIVNGRLNAFSSDQNFKYEHAVGHGYPKAKVDKLLKKLREYKKQFGESKERMKIATVKLKSKNKELASLQKEETTIQKKIDEMLRVKNLLELAKSKTDMNPIFVVRNAPLVDFLDPTLKIQQIVIDTVLDDRYFQAVAKVDRCITCHTFINKTGYENEPNPHRTHPNLEMMVAAESKHPMKKFGCTSCHGGEGHRVNDFNAAAHIPQNEKQKKEWIEKYNWHEPHKIPEPMVKLQYTEGQCIKCHKGVEYVPGADKLNAGIQNMEKYGCYACHKIEGWEHKRMPGPSLQKVANKVSKEFFKNWVWSPKTFNKHAMMPSFFMQDNNSKPQFVKKNIAEVNAIAEYVWNKSEKYEPFAKYEGGNKARGKDLIKEVGCMGCHGVEGWEAESKKTGSYAGPYLTGTGSKVKSPDWLVSWLIKPSHYDADSIMPSFRLTKREANDIASYLLSLKNKKFEELKFEKLDPKVRDEILMTYMTAFDTQEVAKKKLMAMSDRERTLELGHRSIGKYGCYSCHSVDGFDGRGGIGPELTKEGSKPLTQFGFNLQHDIEHSRDGWIKAHLINPRRWDKGLDKPFKDLTRMPMFYLTEKEAESMTLAITGMVEQKIPLKGQHRLDDDQQKWAEGEKLVNKFNCYGCHQVDGLRGEVLAMYDDDINQGPPRLIDEGHRIQADWFYHFLENVQPIRPWLKIRMPSFNLSPEERNILVAGFQGKSRQKTFVELDEDINKSLAWESNAERAEAKKLFEALACTSCHTQGFNKDEAQAPNLYMVKRRLRPTWVKKWLKNPWAIYPETSMPNFWEDGEPTEPGYFGGDSEKQQWALVKYLYEIGFDKIQTPLRKTATKY